MRRISIVAFFMLAVIGCKQHDSIVSVGVDDALAVTDTVRMISVKSELPILAAGRLFVADNHLVMYQFRVEKRFQIYDLPLTGKCFSAGMIGRGPDEFIDPDLRSILGCPQGFYLADQDAFKTVAIKDSSIKVVSKEPLFTDGAPLNGVIKVKDKYVNLDVNAMAPEFDPEGSRQFQVIGSGGVEKRIAELPDWDNNSNNIIRYFSSIVAKPDDEVFAAFYAFGFRKIRYYDLDGNVLKEVSADFPDGAVHTEDGYYMTYATSFASKSRIVVECCNFYRLPKPDSKTPDCTEYQIWDWDGHLTHRLIVPMRLGAYTVDFSTGILYATSSEFEDEIFYSDISEYLK